MSQHYLALECSTSACSVALSVSGKISAFHEILPKAHNARLLDIIQALLQEQAMTPAKLDGIVVSHGPGSFVGCRIALAVAQGLALAHATPIATCSTLQVMAQTLAMEQNVARCQLVLDAKMGEIYLGQYERNDDGVMHAKQGDQAYAITNHHLTECLKESAFVYTDCAQYLSSLGIVAQSIIYPKAVAMFSLLPTLNWERAEKAQPIYLRENSPWKKIK